MATSLRGAPPQLPFFDVKIMFLFTCCWLPIVKPSERSQRWLLLQPGLWDQYSHQSFRLSERWDSPSWHSIYLWRLLQRLRCYVVLGFLLFQQVIKKIPNRWFKMEALSSTAEVTLVSTIGTREDVRCRQRSGMFTKVFILFIFLERRCSTRRHFFILLKRKVSFIFFLLLFLELVRSPRC